MAISSLVYKNLVNQSFEFLVSVYGCTLLPSSKNSYFETYASGDITVDVMYDANRSFELDVRLSYLGTGSPNESISLHEIVHAGGVHGFRTPQVVDERSLASAVENCAMVLKEYGSNYLRGDHFSFRRISKCREKQSIDYGIARDVRMVKAEAEVAWQKKNYMDVFSLLDSIRIYLSDADLKKLEYSQKKSGIK